jgi:hypothetical protein
LPIVVTFDLSEPEPLELNRIRGAFERLGWERMGNTGYRYPRLDETSMTEDWINRVIPALMLLRAVARHFAQTGRGLVKYSIDVHSSTGFNQERAVGTPALSGGEINLFRPSQAGRACAERRLRDWIDGVGWLYPLEDEDEAAS